MLQGLWAIEFLVRTYRKEVWLIRQDASRDSCRIFKDFCESDDIACDKCVLLQTINSMV